MTVGPLPSDQVARGSSAPTRGSSEGVQADFKALLVKLAPAGPSPEGAERAEPRLATRRCHNGISEGVSVVKDACVGDGYGGAVGADVVGWVVLVAGRAGGGGGVQVERPQPEARTNDLDAGGGRRTLDGVDDQFSCSPAWRVFASCPSW